MKTPKRMTIADLAQHLREEIPPGLSEVMIRNHIKAGGLKIDAQHRVDVLEFKAVWLAAKAKDNKNTVVPSPDGSPIKTATNAHKVHFQVLILKEKLEQAKRENEAHKIEHEAKMGKYYLAEDFTEHAKIAIGFVVEMEQTLAELTRDQHLIDRIHAIADEKRNAIAATMRKKQ